MRCLTKERGNDEPEHPVEPRRTYHMRSQFPAKRPCGPDRVSRSRLRAGPGRLAGTGLALTGPERSAQPSTGTAPCTTLEVWSGRGWMSVLHSNPLDIRKWLNMTKWLWNLYSGPQKSWPLHSCIYESKGHDFCCTLYIVDLKGCIRYEFDSLFFSRQAGRSDSRPRQAPNPT